MRRQETKQTDQRMQCTDCAVWSSHDTSRVIRNRKNSNLEKHAI